MFIGLSWGVIVGSQPAGHAPAALRRARRHRPAAAHLLIAGAVIVAVAANYAALRARDVTVRVAVATADVAAGTPVSAAEVGYADIRADDATLATLVPAEHLAAVEEHVTAHRLAAGDLLRRSDLRPPAAPDGQRALSLPVAPGQAAGGRLVPGDRVDVIEVRDGQAAYVVTGALVLDVTGRSGAGGLAGLEPYGVTLAVDDESALRLALAARTAEVDVVRATGAPPALVGVHGRPDDEPAADDRADDGHGAGAHGDRADGRGDRADGRGAVEHGDPDDERAADDRADGPGTAEPAGSGVP